MHLPLCIGIFILVAFGAHANEPTLAQAIDYLEEQEQEQAFRAFLAALDGAALVPTSPSSSEEQALYAEVLAIYLTHTGKAAPKAAAKILETYAKRMAAHPDYLQLGYLIAMAHANLKQYEPFFREFYRSYQAYPNHFLAYKTKALLHLKLMECARDPESRLRERTEVYRFAKEALARDGRDVSLYQMNLSFASDADRPALVRTFLNNMIRDNIIVPRGDLLFFVQVAMDTGERTAAERFVTKAREWYPNSQALDTADELVGVSKGG